jgi:beta-glucosidase-like glycosyl hydrolase
VLLTSYRYTKIGVDVINSTHAQQLNLEAALQSFVLLQNDGGVLPFTRGKKTLLLGPHTQSKRDLMSVRRRCALML